MKQKKKIVPFKKRRPCFRKNTGMLFINTGVFLFFCYFANFSSLMRREHLPHLSIMKRT